MQPSLPTWPSWGVLHGPGALGGPQCIRVMTTKCQESRHSDNRKQVIVLLKTKLVHHSTLGVDSGIAD